MIKPHLPSLAAVITPFPYHINGNCSITSAQAIMHEHHIHHLVVMENNDIAAVISDIDIDHHKAIATSEDDGKLSVSDICSDNLIVADINDPLDSILETMARHHLRHIVVLRQGELAGIFTTTDACLFFAKFLRETCKNRKEPPDIIA